MAPEGRFNLQGIFILMDIIIRRSLFMVILLYFSLFAGCSKKIAENPIDQNIWAKEERTNTYDLSYYITSGDNFQVLFCDYSSIKNPIEKEIQLSENTQENLIETLKFYSKEMTDDILKSDFSVYYVIKLNNVITIEIDAQPAQSYGKNTTYMFAHMHLGNSTYLLGTYVNSSIIDIILGDKE